MPAPLLLKKVGWYVLAGLLIALAIALYLWLLTRGKKEAAAAALLGMKEATFYPAIKSALYQQQAQDVKQVEAAKANLATVRAGLEKEYVDRGLSSEQIADRFRALGVADAGAGSPPAGPAA